MMFETIKSRLKSLDCDGWDEEENNKNNDLIEFP